jgi:hypothetical protein
VTDRRSLSSGFRLINPVFSSRFRQAVIAPDAISTDCLKAVGVSRYGEPARLSVAGTSRSGSLKRMPDMRGLELLPDTIPSLGKRDLGTPSLRVRQIALSYADMGL